MPSVVRLQKVKRAKKRHCGARPSRNVEPEDDYPRVVSDIPIPSIETPLTPPADSPPPENRRKRRREADDETPRPRRRRQASSDEYITVTKVKSVDSTYVFDQYNVEDIPPTACLPWLQRDSAGQYPLPTDRHLIDESLTPPIVRDLEFPDIMDDTKLMIDREYQVKKKVKKNARGHRHEDPDDEEILYELPDDDAYDSVDDQHSQTRPPPPPPPAPKPYVRLLEFPVEIRQRIYRELLTATEPVAVHSDWKKIYRREKVQISLRFLRTCRQIYEEAIPILYGENVFNYRIRDGGNTSATLANINHHAHSAGHSHDSDDDSDSESDWEPEDDAPSSRNRTKNRNKTSGVTARVTRGAAARKRKPTMQDEEEPFIDVEKFAQYFRYLSIEAEGNRYGREIQERMAQAISIFTFDEKGERRLSVHTLAIRITPSKQRKSKHGYTFVDFLEYGSPVVKAAMAVDCQFIRIEISLSILDTSNTAHDCAVGRDIRAVVLDLRHQRIGYNIMKYGERDMWEHDQQMLEQRRQGIELGRTRFVELADSVKEVCERGDDGTSKDVADSDGLDPNAAEFVDDEEGDEAEDSLFVEDDPFSDEEMEEDSDSSSGQDRAHGLTATQVLATIQNASNRETIVEETTLASSGARDDTETPPHTVNVSVTEANYNAQRLEITPMEPEDGNGEGIQLGAPIEGDAGETQLGATAGTQPEDIEDEEDEESDVKDRRATTSQAALKETQVDGNTDTQRGTYNEEAEGDEIHVLTPVLATSDEMHIDEATEKQPEAHKKDEVDEAEVQTVTSKQDTFDEMQLDRPTGTQGEASVAEAASEEALAEPPEQGNPTEAQAYGSTEAQPEVQDGGVAEVEEVDEVEEEEKEDVAGGMGEEKEAETQAEETRVAIGGQVTSSEEQIGGILVADQADATMEGEESTASFTHEDAAMETQPSEPSASKQQSAPEVVEENKTLNWIEQLHALQQAEKEKTRKGDVAVNAEVGST